MSIYLNVIIPSFCLFISCESKIDSPCNLQIAYDLSEEEIEKARIFDLRGIQPVEITPPSVWYYLHEKYILTLDDDTIPPPYNDYFIKHIDFSNELHSQLTFSDGHLKEYIYSQDECDVDLVRPGDTLEARLLVEGRRIVIEKYAIYTYNQKPNGKHEFIFIEFKSLTSKSLEEIIRQFDLVHPGEYDTIAVELVSSF